MEIDIPALFAGRKQQVLSLARALHTEGSCPIVYGDRGLGKSSLALQGARMATGDVELLGRYRALEWEFGEDSEFVAFYVTCTDATRNTEALLQRVLNALSAVSLDESRQMKLLDRTRRTSFKLKLFEAQFEQRTAPQEKVDYSDKNVEEKLIEVATRHTSASGQPVLIIVDELDRVQDTQGLASFLKSYSSDGLKFMLVGIGQTLSSLISDHASIERIGIPVRVPKMEPQELMLIIEHAMGFLALQEIKRSFSAEATLYLAEVASGFPWFVHVLAQSALLGADDEGATRVTRRHVVEAINALSTNEYAQWFQERYHDAVRDSAPREIVLRAFAHWDDPLIPTSEVYRVLKERLGVRNPSAYKGHLCTDKYRRIFLPDQTRGRVRFSNELFKVFARLVESIYDGVDHRVAAAWDEEPDQAATTDQLPSSIQPIS